MQWHKAFNTRQLQEIEFARIYKKDFSHGTDGHNAKMIIAQMAEILDTVEYYGMLSEDISHDNESPK